VQVGVIIAAATLGAAIVLAPCARAAVSAEEAQQLRTNLTPIGAERAGNAEGTIPAWSGGYTTPVAGYQQGRPRPDPFSDEKPLFSITAANLNVYGARLPEGAKALFAKFPDYRMDVYPTHRTAAAPLAWNPNHVLEKSSCEKRSNLFEMRPGAKLRSPSSALRLASSAGSRFLMRNAVL